MPKKNNAQLSTPNRANNPTSLKKIMPKTSQTSAHAKPLYFHDITSKVSGSQLHLKTDASVIHSRPCARIPVEQTFLPSIAQDTMPDEKSNLSGVEFVRNYFEAYNFLLYSAKTCPDLSKAPLWELLKNPAFPGGAPLAFFNKNNESNINKKRKFKPTVRNCTDDFISVSKSKKYTESDECTTNIFNSSSSNCELDSFFNQEYYQTHESKNTFIDNQAVDEEWIQSLFNSP